MNNKISKKEIAEESLNIIKLGYYNYNNQTIDVAFDVKKSRDETFTISPEEWPIKLTSRIQKSFEKTKLEVVNYTSIQAIQQLNGKGKTAILNFASAKNPGGGFMGGASAQEESLARSSSLYDSITKDTRLYNFNKVHSTFLYSDYMIYSPSVVFWCDDNGNKTREPFFTDVITSPAPNKGAILKHNRIDELVELEKVFKSRIEKVLLIAEEQAVENLILGAWGCGVFRNDTKLVASMFADVIKNSFKTSFKTISFAISTKDDAIINDFKAELLD